MTIIFEDNKPREITKPEEFTFTAKVGELYYIQLTARAKGEKQLGGTDDEDLRLEIDGRKLSSLTNTKRYFDPDLVL